MGLETIPSRSNGQTIDQDWYNILARVIAGDFVPRISANAPPGDIQGSLGSTSYRWLSAYLKTLNIGELTKLITIGSPVVPTAYSLTLPTGLPTPGPNSSLPLLVSPAGLMTYQKLPPSGTIVAYGGTAAPTDWLLCNGTSYLRTDYADLFAVIGSAFGAADGTHFNVPDLRGRFLRGLDGAAGRDPDSASRTAMNTGGNTGNNMGSVQADQLRSHLHALPFGDGGISGSNMTYNDNLRTNSIRNSSNTGGNETRPLNAYVNFIIKT